jgi:hypothetical protein
MKYKAGDKLKNEYGTLTVVSPNEIIFAVDEDGDANAYTANELEQKEYTLVTPEPPKPPKDGQAVWVRQSDCHEWRIRVATGEIEKLLNSGIWCYGDDSTNCTWRHWKPFNAEKDGE